MRKVKALFKRNPTKTTTGPPTTSNNVDIGSGLDHPERKGKGKVRDDGQIQKSLSASARQVSYYQHVVLIVFKLTNFDFGRRMYLLHHLRASPAADPYRPTDLQHIPRLKDPLVRGSLHLLHGRHVHYQLPPVRLEDGPFSHKPSGCWIRLPTA